MPLFYEYDDGFAKIAIWHIVEEKKFFINKVPLQREISHPHKQLQHLAGRYLLQYMYADFPYDLIEIADTRKPFLPGEEYHFSISHCGDYAAAIVSKEKRVGIDVELVTPKIQKIQHKFLNDKEMSFVNSQSTNQLINQLTLLWCCKEAVFKWYAIGGVDFKEDIKLQPFEFNNDAGCINCNFLKDETTTLKINYKWFDDVCLAWVV